MRRPKPKKDKVPKITEEEYAAYLSSLRASASETSRQESDVKTAPNTNG